MTGPGVYPASPEMREVGLAVVVGVTDGELEPSSHAVTGHRQIRVGHGVRSVPVAQPGVGSTGPQVQKISLPITVEVTDLPIDAAGAGHTVARGQVRVSDGIRAIAVAEPRVDASRPNVEQVGFAVVVEVSNLPADASGHAVTGHRQVRVGDGVRPIPVAQPCVDSAVPQVREVTLAVTVEVANLPVEATCHAVVSEWLERVGHRVGPIAVREPGVDASRPDMEQVGLPVATDICNDVWLVCGTTVITQDTRNGRALVLGVNHTVLVAVRRRRGRGRRLARFSANVKKLGWP